MPDQAMPAVAAARARAAPWSRISSVERVLAPVDGHGRGRAAGVLEGIGESFLDDPVGGEVQPRREVAALAAEFEDGRQARRAGARDQLADLGQRRLRREHRRAAPLSTPSRWRISPSASRPVRSMRVAASSARPGSRSRIRRAPPAWTTITLIECATRSCISRAIRRRSSTAASCCSSSLASASCAAASCSSAVSRVRARTARPAEPGDGDQRAAGRRSRRRSGRPSWR